MQSKLLITLLAV